MSVIEGLPDRDRAELETCFRTLPDLRAVLLFGSRARQDHRRTSDVDLAAFTHSQSRNTVLDLSDRLNHETYMPYHFDVIDMGALSDKALLEEIRRDGQIIWGDLPADWKG